MAYLETILGSFLVLIGFFALTQYEVRRGERFFARHRERLDEAVTRAVFVVHHVDFAHFLETELKHAAAHSGHALAQLSLRAVRAAERLLTRAVRRLRLHHEAHETKPRSESKREFVKTLSGFKEDLKTARPHDISDIG